MNELQKCNLKDVIYENEISIMKTDIYKQKRLLENLSWKRLLNDKAQVVTGNIKVAKNKGYSILQDRFSKKATKNSPSWFVICLGKSTRAQNMCEIISNFSCMVFQFEL